jgi:2-oxo-4-hydroxy-4-carboxy-5-ureidoimidazoline decarboxylase
VTLERLNTADAAAAGEALRRCCGASAWIAAMLASRPFASREALHAAAARCADALGPDDWREAFAHHPRIGDVGALRARFAATATWAGGEQAGAAGADESTLLALAEGNRAYEARFGHIFIVCATGRTAAEMLVLLAARLQNDAATELRNAAVEQAKITRLRLDKLLEEGS